MRELVPQERQQLQWDELVEDEAAAMEMQRERREWASQESDHYPTWQQWASAAVPPEQGVKRARVQVRVQGEDGRVVRDEHYNIALRDGEQLVYQVGVRTPVATEREAMGVYAAEATDSLHSEGAGSSTDPPRHLRPASDEGGDRSAQMNQDKTHIDAEEFAATPLGQKFYGEWKKGVVGPALIGQRFGYHVLGKFASMLEDERERAEQVQSDRDSGLASEPERGTASGGARFELRPPPAETLVLNDSLETMDSGVAAGTGEAVEDEATEGEVLGEGLAMQSATPSVPMAVNAATSTSTTGASLSGSSGTEGRGRRVQTSLESWLWGQGQ